MESGGETPFDWREAYRITPLPPDEELALILAFQRGDEEALKRLTHANLRLLVNIAKTYRPNRRLSMEELIESGRAGLRLAAEGYDPAKGFRFSTYATHWIRQSIGRKIQGDDSGSAFRTPPISD